MSRLGAVGDVWAELAPLVDEIITPRRLAGTLQAVADAPAPSQTASITRGAVVAGLLEREGVLDAGAKYSTDVADSGCDLLEAGVGGLRIVAHLDEISYVLRGPGHGDRWPLLAYCYHLADGPRPARVLRYSSPGGYRVVASGVVGGAAADLWFTRSDGEQLEPGDRVALASPLTVDSVAGRVTGSLDNAAGVAAALLAAQVLTRYGTPFSVLLPDEEEGPAGRASQTISRGAGRVLRHLAPAPVTAVVDVHGLGERDATGTAGHTRPWGASLAEYSSATRGSVTPPPLYRALRRFAAELRDRGVAVRENLEGYVPRSDDVVAMLHSPAVCLLGYPGSDRHFDRGVPSANLADLRALATALAVLGVVVAAGALEQEGRP